MDLAATILFFVIAITKKMAALYYFATFFMLQASYLHQLADYDEGCHNKSN
jgi:hypothetical protein